MKRLMMMSGVVAVLALVAGLRGADAPRTQPTMEAIRYERSGGFAGTHDVVEISKDGAIVVQGKLLKSGKGQLTKDEAAKLTALFAGWGDLKANYPAPPGSADGFTVKIQYGTKEVTASDMNKELPESFKAAQAAIEAAAQSAAKGN